LNETFSKISVIGLGYVGLPTAAVFASRGLQVHGVDVNDKAIELISQGKIHIVEPDLDIMVNGAVARGRLSVSKTPEPSDAFIIAVPTPFTGERKPNLDYIEAATKSIAPVLEKGSLVILESTSPVGTTEKISNWLGTYRSDLVFPHQAGDNADIQIAHSPERVLPGRVLLELVRNDRVVGGLTRRCAERAAALYKMAIEGECHLTTAATAELVKLTENAYRDVNIAFANELSLIADKLDINVWEAIELANRHPRVDILNPGPGVGGHCIAVDPWFIVDSAPDESPLIQTARHVNDGKPEKVVKQLLQQAKQVNANTIACLGLAYKADIDDMRESPAVEIVDNLGQQFDGDILVVEPNAESLPDVLTGRNNISMAGLDNALCQSPVIALLVDHKDFRELDRTQLDGKKIVDTRGIWR